MTTQEGVPPDSLVARMIGELNANPEARALLLRMLLTDDFLLLPAKVDRLMELPAKTDSLQEDVSKLMELPAKVDRIQEEVRQITTDLAPIRGSHARDAALRAVRRIARIVNCRLQEQLNDDDLHDFTANNDATGITPEDLRSFENADVVLRASHRDTGEINYIAVEASFTGGEDDTRRALRNARYLTRFTGHPGHAVVAALRLTTEAEAAVEQGKVTWYESERRHLEPA